MNELALTITIEYPIIYISLNYIIISHECEIDSKCLYTAMVK